MRHSECPIVCQYTACVHACAARIRLKAFFATSRTTHAACQYRSRIRRAFRHFRTRRTLLDRVSIITTLCEVRDSYSVVMRVVFRRSSSSPSRSVVVESSWKADVSHLPTNFRCDNDYDLRHEQVMQQAVFDCRPTEKIQLSRIQTLAVAADVARWSIDYLFQRIDRIMIAGHVERAPQLCLM